LLRKTVFIFANFASLFFLAGCGGNQPKVADVHDARKVILSDSRTIAYAYMKNGEKLVRISTSREKPRENEEIIRITRGGFYPDYSMNREVALGKKSPGCLVHMSPKDKDYAICHSHYMGREALYTGVATIVNTVATVTTVGLNVASGAITDPKFFHFETFEKAIKANDLFHYRDMILEAVNLSAKRSKDIEKLYDRSFSVYRDNAKEITFAYEIKDRSGLLPSRNDIEFPVRVVLDAPKRKRFDYEKLIDFSVTPEIFDNRMANVKNAILSESKSEEEAYRKYLKEKFDHYVVHCPKTYTYEYNEHIHFHTILKAPERVAYKPGKPMKVGIYATVDYADLYAMLPKKFHLEDKNLVADFMADSNAWISVIVSNRTQSFVTVKSLTSYYLNLVSNLSGIRREIAPESKTLTSNSRYDLLSDIMKKRADFSKMTKSEAKKTHVNYGYAIKYRINNTNIEKSIYKTRKISLYDIYKSYI
jgi:hypothetical protein